jgi:siroheme synthase-like protein
MKETNHLFPVFLKLEDMRVLLIGAGNVGIEKLQAIINNSPAATVRVVAKKVSEEFAQLASQHNNVHVIEGEYEPSCLNDCHIVIAAVNDIALSTVIRNDAKAKGKLINVADKPYLCDFYLGSVVTKGNLKMAISTNGKSPTMAKRLKEIFQEMMPEELDEVMNNLHIIRNSLEGDFQNKIKELNKITQSLVEKPLSEAEKYEQYWFL